MLRAVPLLLVSYVIGSVPVPFVIGRAAGADLRRTGTGVVGAANLARTRAAWAVAPAGVVQIGQGMLPPLLMKARGQPEAGQVMAGLCSISAHAWNPWLGFQGGRGMAHSIGFLLALSPASLAGFAVCGVLGRLAGQVPLSMLVGLVLSAPLAAASKRPPTVVAGCALVTLMTVVRRIQGSTPLRQDRRVAIWRILFDRDVRDRDEWLARLEP